MRIGQPCWELKSDRCSCCGGQGELIFSRCSTCSVVVLICAEWEPSTPPGTRSPGFRSETPQTPPDALLAPDHSTTTIHPRLRRRYKRWVSRLRTTDEEQSRNRVVALAMAHTLRVMPTESNSGPKFRVLDVVVALPDAADEQSRKGTVTQVRQYPGNRFAYVVAPHDPREVGTIFYQEDLIATNERTNVDTLTAFGRFRTREVVRISSNCRNQQIAGRKGVICGGFREDDSALAVWIDDLERVCVVPAADLISTGQRRPPERRNHMQSLRVSEKGELLGCDTYIVLQDIEDL